MVAATRQLYQTHREAQRESLETRFEWQRQQQAIANLNARHRLTVWLMWWSASPSSSPRALCSCCCIRGHRRQKRLARLEMQQQLEH